MRGLGLTVSAMRMRSRIAPLAVCLALSGCSAPSGSGASSDCVGPDDEDAPRQAQADPPSCTPRPDCPHKGGYAPHDRCADRSGNVAWNGQLLSNDQLPDLRDPPTGFAGLGCDVGLGRRIYDAMSWNAKQRYRRLWEVKTNDWSNSYKYNDELKACTFNQMIDTFRNDCLQVLACNKGFAGEADKFTYVLGFSDPGLYWAVVNYFANADNYDREIMAQARAQGLTDDPRVYCTIDNLQRCR